MFRNISAWFLARLHCPVESHLKLRRYHFVFLVFTCPPGVCDDPENILRPYWAIWTVSVVGVVGDGAIWMMV